MIGDLSEAERVFRCGRYEGHVIFITRDLSSVISSIA